MVLQIHLTCLHYFVAMMDMKLSHYISSRKLKPLHAARELGVTHQSFHLWLAGKRIPREEQMIAIYHWSKGAVQPNDFYDLTQKINDLPLFTGNGQAMPPGGGVVSVYSQGGP